MSWSSINALMLVIVFLTQCFKVYQHINSDKRLRKHDAKVDQFLRVQSEINTATLDIARATKALAASIGSEAIRTMHSVKQDMKDVKDSMGSDSGSLKNTKV